MQDGRLQIDFVCVALRLCPGRWLMFSYGIFLLLLPSMVVLQAGDGSEFQQALERYSQVNDLHSLEQAVSDSEEEAVPFIVESIRNDLPTVDAAIRACSFVEIGGNRLGLTLVDLLDEGAISVQVNACRAIGALGARGKIWAKEVSSRLERRWMTVVALDTLGKLGDSESLPVIVERLEASSAKVRFAAIRSLNQFGEAGAVYVDRVLDSLKVADENLRGDRFHLATKEDFEFRIWCLRAVGGFGAKARKGSDLLVKYLKRAPDGSVHDLEFKSELVRCLGKVGGQPTEKVLRAIYSDARFYPEQLGPIIEEVLQEVRSPGYY